MERQEVGAAGRPRAGAGAPSHPSGDRRYQLLDRTMSQNQHSQDSLIEVLHSAQELFGYLSEDLLVYIAQKLKLPPSRVYGVATFYNFFSLEPKGKHTCTVCLGTACYVKGAANILASLTKELNVEPGKTTADGSVSLEPARCLGACGLAPAVVFDGEIAAQVTPQMAVERVRKLIAEPVVGGAAS